MARPKAKIPLIQPSSAPFNNPFAQSLAASHGTKRPAEVPETAPSAGATGAAAAPRSAAALPSGAHKKAKLPKQKFHIHHERKGRGGKTVTLIGGLGGSAEYLGDIAKQLRRALGCGASVEGDTVVLQGDHQERAAAWLSKL